jgi:hypothetical protein
LKLAVTSAPSSIASVTFLKGLPYLVGQGIPFHTYTIQASSNLVDWAGIGTAAANTAGQFSFDDQATALPQRFYRILSP